MARATGQGNRPLPTPELIDRIVHHHHTYLRLAEPCLLPLATKVGRIHRGRDPRVTEVAEAVHTLFDVALPHMDDEEDLLFPALLGDPLGLGAVLAAVHRDHATIDAELARLRALTDGFVAPEGADESWRTLLQELLALETDLAEHLRLENGVLLPWFVR